MPPPLRRFEALAGWILGGALLLAAAALLPAQQKSDPVPTSNPYIHWNRSWEVAFRPDGSMIAGGSTDEPKLRLWRVPSLEALQTFGSHGEAIEALAWHPAGKLLASGSRDRTIKIWDSESGAELHTLSGHDGWVWDLAWSPDGRRLASAGYDGAVKLWDAEQGRLLETLPISELPLFAVTWSSDGKLLAAGGKQGPIWIWDAETLASRPALRGHESGVACLSFGGPDRLASGGWDRLVKIWSATEAKQELELGGHRGAIHDLVASPDGRYVASISTDGSLIIWNADNGSLVERIHGSSEGMRSLDWSSDGRYLVAVEWRIAQLRLFATEDWKQIAAVRG
ncbi:MAG TPA: WD40 repeat domain-containing protein [Acidobacteriota bacterium]